MGADEATSLDALVGRGEILHELTATHGGRRALSRASWMKRLFICRSPPPSSFRIKLPISNKGAGLP